MRIEGILKAKSFTPLSIVQLDLGYILKYFGPKLQKLNLRTKLADRKFKKNQTEIINLLELNQIPAIPTSEIIKTIAPTAAQRPAADID